MPTEITEASQPMCKKGHEESPRINSIGWLRGAAPKSRRNSTQTVRANIVSLRPSMCDGISTWRSPNRWRLPRLESRSPVDCKLATRHKSSGLFP
jgi:hypothetical protein